MNGNGELFSYLRCRTFHISPIFATFTFILPGHCWLWGVPILVCLFAHIQSVMKLIVTRRRTHGNYDKFPNNVPVLFTTIYHRPHRDRSCGRSLPTDLKRRRNIRCCISWSFQFGLEINALIRLWNLKKWQKLCTEEEIWIICYVTCLEATQSSIIPCVLAIIN